MFFIVCTDKTVQPPARAPKRASYLSMWDVCMHIHSSSLIRKSPNSLPRWAILESYRGAVPYPYTHSGCTSYVATLTHQSLSQLSSVRVIFLYALFYRGFYSTSVGIMSSLVDSDKVICFTLGLECSSCYAYANLGDILTLPIAVNFAFSGHAYR